MQKLAYIAGHIAALSMLLNGLVRCHTPYTAGSGIGTLYFLGGLLVLVVLRRQNRGLFDPPKAQVATGPEDDGAPFEELLGAMQKQPLWQAIQQGHEGQFPLQEVHDIRYIDAVPVRQYYLEDIDVEAILYSEVVNIPGAIPYRHILTAGRCGQEPSSIATSEGNRMDAFLPDAIGSHFFCFHDGTQRHNLGSDDRWDDLEEFAAAALEKVVEAHAYKGAIEESKPDEEDAVHLSFLSSKRRRALRMSFSRFHLMHLLSPNPEVQAQAQAARFRAQVYLELLRKKDRPWPTAVLIAMLDDIETLFELIKDALETPQSSFDVALHKQKLSRDLTLPTGVKKQRMEELESELQEPKKWRLRMQKILAAIESQASHAVHVEEL